MPADTQVHCDSMPAIAVPRRTLSGAFARMDTALRIATLLFRANLRARHRRMALGYLWLAIPGAVSALTFALLRKHALIGTGEVGVPYALFVLSGVFLWQSLGDGVNVPVQQLNYQRRFLAIVPAPFQAVLLAALAEALLNLCVRLVILACAMLAFGLAPSAAWLAIVACGLTMTLCGFALSLLVAPFAQLFDDIGSLVAMAITFGMFVSPVFYPVPAGSLLAASPFAGVLETARLAIAGTFAPTGLLPALACALLLLVPGWLFNAISRPHIAARAH
ncbi:ABC transporter permease [Novosphingobium sp. TH158]|uniref:ABC transporter permease n=1 Tax=Novosphingobium sp. TH158 TaxID=2067455 RepID=UPI000C7C2E38|nr:ABC transporter permease [Novosphingobium sp. TH158]PLK26769.1 hypothetical protein C0V78_07600 [Novosphingobium sp. TH158]